MSTRPEITAEVRRWVEKAENDFRNAEYVLTLKENCPFDTVSYHCQQCVEKYLKALLILRGVDFPRTHDLVVLFNLLREVETLTVQVQDVQPLNRYSIAVKYFDNLCPRSQSSQSLHPFPHFQSCQTYNRPVE